MYQAIILTTIKERLTNIVRLIILLGIMVVQTATYIIIGKDYGDLSDAMVFTLVMGAGIIGQDISRGVLQLLFVRPIKRANYILSKWLAISILGFSASLFQIAILVLKLYIEQEKISGAALANVVVGRLFICLATAALLSLFSTLAPGMADIVIYLIIIMIVQGLRVLGQTYGFNFMVQLSYPLEFFVNPTINIHTTLTTLMACLFNISLCLLIASVVINRREISYAD